MNIERQPVIQRRNLTIDPQCCTVTLVGEEACMYMVKVICSGGEGILNQESSVPSTAFS